MEHPREQDRPAHAKRTRRRNTFIVSTDDQSPHVRLKAGEMVAEVPISKLHLRHIVTNKRVLGQVISGYADAAAKARRTGKDHMITYRVSPDGKAVEVADRIAEKPEDGPLGAAIARAKARGTTKVTEILRQADMVTAREFGPLIGASHETVNIKRKRHEILGLEGATRGVKYPRWQVTEAGMPLPGLARLFKVFGEQPWTVYRFLRTAHAELGGRTALDAMKAGQTDAVIEMAEHQAAGAFA